MSRLVGAPPGYVGYEEGGQLTEAVRRRPYAVVLLDEIEKAHPDVFNVLLQLLDDGRLTDGQGRTVDFTNTVLIMTSNLGGGGDEAHGDDRGAQPLQAGVPEPHRRDRRVPPARRGAHRADRRASRSSSCATRLAERNLGLELTDAALAHLAKVGYDPDFGARPLKRVLQREVADPIALGLLKGEYPDGDVVVVDATSDGELVVQPPCDRDHLRPARVRRRRVSATFRRALRNSARRRGRSRDVRAARGGAAPGWRTSRGSPGRS